MKDVPTMTTSTMMTTTTTTMTGIKKTSPLAKNRKTPGNYPGTKSRFMMKSFQKLLQEETPNQKKTK